MTTIFLIFVVDLAISACEPKYRLQIG